MKRLVIQLLLCIGLTSCTRTILFPICPNLASAKPSSTPGVGKTIDDACRNRSIKITVLSSSIASFEGSLKQMKWLQKHYHIMICDFDSKTIADTPGTYTGCMLNSQKWINIVQGPDKHKLMDRNNQYYNYCPH